MSVQMIPDAKVRWTDALQRKCEPLLGTVREIEPLPPAADAWRRVRALYLASADAWRAGASRASAPHAALIRTVDTSFASEDPPPPGSLNLDVEAARGAMCGAVAINFYFPFGGTIPRDEYNTILDFWGAHAGLGFAVLAHLRAETHRRYGEFGQNGSLSLWLGDPASRSYARPTEPWRRLRRQLVAAQVFAAADYDAALKTVADVWPTLSVHERATIAYAFPSEDAWVEEAADDVLRVLTERQITSLDRDDERMAWLLFALRDPARATAMAPFLDKDRQSEEMFATMLANLGVDAAGPLIALERSFGPPQGTLGEFWLRVMSAIESRDVAAYFADHLTHTNTTRVAGEYFQRFPYLAVPVLEAAVRGGSKEAALFLAGLNPASPADPTSTSSVDESDLSGVPDVLINPPWLAKRSARQAPTVLSIEPRSLVPRIEWTDAERSGYRQDQYMSRQEPRSPERDKQLLPELARGNAFMWSFFQLTDEAALSLWRTKPSREWLTVDVMDIQRVLAWLDTAALPGAVACVRRFPKSISALEKVVSDDVVTLMANAAWRLKDAGKIAEAWLLRYAKDAVTRLVPAAVGKPGDERSAAEHALRFLDARGQGELVRSASKSYGQACATAIEEILSVKAETLPTKVPALPPFWVPAHWPRPKLADTGRALPLSAINHLGVMLAVSPLDAPMSSLAEVKAGCDPASLGLFAWALFEAWRLAGLPPKQEWAFQALGHLGTDDTARQLEPIIRAWPSAGGIARATTGLDILATIGSDTALSLLHGIAQKVKSRPLQNRAAQRIQDIATRRGLTGEQLADRLVPDLDFDAAGTRILDFGSRKFRVSLDARLKPEVRALTGERLRDLPKPGRADDPDQAAAAVADWKALKKTVAAVVPLQIARLERAMCDSRRWSTADFLAYIVNHPLIGQLARRVIWTAYDESARVMSFRVAEDRTFADPQDAPFTLTPTAHVGLLHPLEADAATLAAWTQRMVDYEIIQPFPQLGRPVFHASPEELEARKIVRVNNRTVDIGRVLALERRGWRRGQPMDAGVATEMIKPLARATAEAYLDISPGIALYAVTEFAQQTLGEVMIARVGVDAQRGVRVPLPLSALDSITASELLADLESLIT